MLSSIDFAEALPKSGDEGAIGKYFNLFCPTNGESVEGGMAIGGTTAQEKTLSASRRFIFDDEVPIMGSANINPRSMDGSRDSEIATMSCKSELLSTPLLVRVHRLPLVENSVSVAIPYLLK